MIIVTGRVITRSERLDEALRVSREHVERSRAEPGCLVHSVHQDAEDPNILFFFEQWEDQDALSAHFAVPESLAFVTALSECAAAPPVMDIYEAEPLSS
jgi:quinol monooxygenase YgiN